MGGTAWRVRVLPADAGVFRRTVAAIATRGDVLPADGRVFRADMGVRNTPVGAATPGRAIAE